MRGKQSNKFHYKTWIIYSLSKGMFTHETLAKSGEKYEISPRMWTILWLKAVMSCYDAQSRGHFSTVKSLNLGPLSVMVTVALKVGMSS